MMPELKVKNGFPTVIRFLKFHHEKKTVWTIFQLNLQHSTFKNVSSFVEDGAQKGRCPNPYPHRERGPCGTPVGYYAGWRQGEGPGRQHTIFEILKKYGNLKNNLSIYLILLHTKQ